MNQHFKAIPDAPFLNEHFLMNVQVILDFYVKNGLYQSNHDYADKLHHLQWFYQHDHLTIDLLTDYCTYRSIAGVKNSTINRELTVLRSALNYYLKHNETANFKNVLNGFKLFEADYIPRFLSSNECTALLAATLHYDNWLLHDFILLALNTGCRASELTKLTWDNVYLSERYFIVRNSLSKNRKTVYKPLNAVSIAALERLRIHHHYVFYSKRTGKNIRSFRRGFELAVDRAKLGKVRIHDLRHTFASFLVRQGVPLYHVSTLLGHSDVRITQKYAHLSPDHLHAVLQHLPALA
ncbi:tyrosine-type recombinase/integrase [Alkanindiges sp. WGS2144]|uniref:tyrosine-type recombinase/integrase n=1 Tax=Alkanindiges sp. WGS2144 TaxID=3366808 RepID=UPI003751323B